jgi:hypothetical protein
MTDYRQKVGFKPAPVPVPSAAAFEPTIQMQPIDFNLPPEAILPTNVNEGSPPSILFPEVNSKVPEPNESGK